MCILLAYAITVLAVVPLFLRAAAGTGDLRQGAATGRVSPGQAGQVREIPLSFVPEPVEELPPGEPGQDWQEQKSVALAGIVGKRQVSVRLYTDAPVSDPFLQGEVWGLLDDGTASFDLSMVSNYGLQGVNVRSGDVNGDGREELVITGGMGATYIERKIISYDPVKKRWLKLLTMGTPWDGDLDGDGQEDVVAVSAGVVPGYVWIYRWNEDHFEKADVAESTGNLSARVATLDGTTWIEAGQANEPHYYRYRGGKLWSCPTPRLTGSGRTHQKDDQVYQYPPAER